MSYSPTLEHFNNTIFGSANHLYITGMSYIIAVAVCVLSALGLWTYYLSEYTIALVCSLHYAVLTKM